MRCLQNAKKTFAIPNEILICNFCVKGFIIKKEIIVITGYQFELQF